MENRTKMKTFCIIELGNDGLRKRFLKFYFQESQTLCLFLIISLRVQRTKSYKYIKYFSFKFEQELLALIILVLYN